MPVSVGRLQQLPALANLQHQDLIAGMKPVNNLGMRFVGRAQLHLHRSNIITITNKNIAVGAG